MSTNSCWHRRALYPNKRRYKTMDCQVISLCDANASDVCLTSHLGGTGPSCADVTSPEHLLVAEDAAAGVLLIVQELLEGAESSLGV